MADVSLEVDEHVVALVKQAREAKDARDRWQEVYEDTKEQILSALGEADQGTFMGAPIVAVQHVRRTSLDTKRLRAEFPDLAERFTRESWSTTLRTL